MIVKEGRVVIDTGEAFYNPRMEMNRDITVACLEALPDITTYIDVMSASGIRGIRVKKEVSRDIEVTSNDWDEPACELIKRNAETNGVSIEISNCGANTLALSSASTTSWTSTRSARPPRTSTRSAGPRSGPWP